MADPPPSPIKLLNHGLAAFLIALPAMVLAYKWIA
jgi:hypothetical protein